MRPLQRLVALGFLLGGAAAAVWFATRPSASDLLATRYSLPSTSPALAAWTWRDSDTPPPLPAAYVAPAVAAWVAQRGPDGAPADFATRAASLRALLVRLPAEGFSHIIDALARSGRDDDALLLRETFDSWVVLDAPAAARWAAPRGAASIDFARHAIRIWSTEDAEAAATWICALPDENIAARLATPALATLAEKDPARALALARSRGQSFRLAALAGIVNALGRANPADAVRTYGPELWRNGSGIHTLREPLAAWVKQDPPAALAWLVAQPRDANGNPFHWINTFGDRTQEWRRTVADAFLNGPDQTRRVASVAPLLGEWNREHPGEVLAWLDEIEDRDLRMALLEHTVGQHSAAHPDQNLALVLALPEGQGRTMHLGAILTEWAKTDAPAALAWIEAHDAPGVATAGYQVQGTLLAAIAREEPQTAIAEWAALKDPRAREVTLASIVQSWSEKDPLAAIRWANEQSQAMGEVLQLDPGVVSRWAAKEPEAALRWIEAWLPTQPETTAAFMAPYYLSALGGNWENRAPRADTADLLVKIKDPALRATALATHFAEWRTTDPAAARAWLEKSAALSPEQVAALLQAKSE